jgi:hypothetical protein
MDKLFMNKYLNKLILSINILNIWNNISNNVSL